jgi:hypothetical protein
MQVLSPKPQTSPEKQGRRKGRKPGKPLTARELATRRANLEKARAALSEGYPPTEKRLRASRANFEKALAARRSPRGNAAARLNALKHGLFAQQTLAESVGRLGEDKEEFEQHLRLFQRVFVPADEEEKRIVRGLAETVWRRLRFFRAQACWEKERLQSMFAEAPAPDRLGPEGTVARADRLALALMEFEAFYRELSKLESQVEFLLRKLIRKRSDGKLRWKGFSPRRDPVMEKLEKEDEIDRFVKYWDALSPEEQAAVRDEARKKVDAKMAEWERVQAPTNPRRG